MGAEHKPSMDRDDASRTKEGTAAGCAAVAAQRWHGERALPHTLHIQKAAGAAQAGGHRLVHSTLHLRHGRSRGGAVRPCRRCSVLAPRRRAYNVLVSVPARQRALRHKRVYRTGGYAQSTHRAHTGHTQGTHRAHTGHMISPDSGELRSSRDAPPKKKHTPHPARRTPHAAPRTPHPAPRTPHAWRTHGALHKAHTTQATATHRGCPTRPPCRRRPGSTPPWQ
jgi:hypothetical protein